MPQLAAIVVEQVAKVEVVTVVCQEAQDLVEEKLLHEQHGISLEASLLTDSLT